MINVSTHRLSNRVFPSSLSLTNVCTERQGQTVVQKNTERRGLEWKKWGLLVLVAGLWLAIGGKSHAQDCASGASQIALQDQGFSSTEDTLRLNQMKDDLRQLRLQQNVPEACTFRMILRLNTPRSQTADVFGSDEQGFQLARNAKTVTISASSSIGVLYGFYEVLDRLGYRFPRPSEVMAPATIAWSRIPAQIDIKPRLPLRGFWAFGKELDSEFLIWAGRNRFNLVGADFKSDASIRKTFAIKKWAGGHNVISRLTPTDKPVNGVNLATANPQWFGGNATNAIPANAIPHDSETYRNPCFGDEGYARFFANQLVRSLKEGELKNTDILNLWPSDLLSLSLPADCKRAPESKGNLDDLVYFYNTVSKRIADEKDLVGSDGKRPVIAGISYQNDYDFSGTAKKLPPKNSGAYIHVYYNSLRSHAREFFDAKPGLNSQISAQFLASKRNHEASATGIVEYHNYSIFNGMIAPELDVLKADLAAFQRNGASLYAYMHPTRSPTMAEMLLNRAFSRLSFADESVADIRTDFEQRNLGAVAPAREALRDYSTALASRADLFGADLSLNIFNQTDYAWIPPIVPLKVGREASQAIIEGRQAVLPPLRFTKLKPVTMQSPALTTIIEKLESARQKAEMAVAAAQDPALRGRLAAMSSEFARTLGIHRHLLNVSLARQAGYAGEASRCRDLTRAAATQLQPVLAMPWPEYLSAMDMKGLYSRSQMAYLDFLQTKGCDAAVK
jgi:hypothetical protein